MGRTDLTGVPHVASAAPATAQRDASGERIARETLADQVAAFQQLVRLQVDSGISPFNNSLLPLARPPSRAPPPLSLALCHSLRFPSFPRLFPTAFRFSFSPSHAPPFSLLFRLLLRCCNLPRARAPVPRPPSYINHLPPLPPPSFSPSRLSAPTQFIINQPPHFHQNTLNPSKNLFSINSIMSGRK